VDSTSEVVFETIPGTDLSVISSSISAKDGQISSPADLHGMWYPTVRRTLVCLSKLFRCLDVNNFSNIEKKSFVFLFIYLEKYFSRFIARNFNNVCTIFDYR
jgi:hypothetical protein